MTTWDGLREKVLQFKQIAGQYFIRFIFTGKAPLLFLLLYLNHQIEGSSYI